MRPRVKNGPLDPLFAEVPKGRVSEFDRDALAFVTREEADAKGRT